RAISKSLKWLSIRLRPAYHRSHSRVPRGALPSIMANTPANIVTAITGASGALYAQRFVQGLVAAGVNVHLVVSPLGRRLLHDEIGMETIDLTALAGGENHTITLYNYNDVGSKL